MKKSNNLLITLAREAAGITQEELAEGISIEQGYLSKVENGLSEPSEEIISKISAALGYHPSFFSQDWVPIRLEGHYRRKISLPSKELKECKAKMTIAEKHLEILCQSIELPTPNYPRWNIQKDGPALLCGKFLREYWRVSKGKISNVISLLEDNGFIIIELDMGEIDGFSALSSSNIPVIFLNKHLSGDRYHLTAVHEAIHFVMHHGQIIDEDRDVEKEAYEAAHEFLVPISNIEGQLRRITISTLADLKQYWGVSMQSLIVKAFKSALITKHQYQYLFKQMTALGYRKKEPIEIQKEKPSLLHELISSHFNDFGYSKVDLGKLLLNFTEEQIDEWYFNKRNIRLKILRKIA